ncbi:hypothetical protein GON03_21270 [Nocardioides sp. MAH-18]|uniref:Uncharacterized protein n=1 Tax=Nocardioides agri TaxID=2682843 RepID=A0A6L6XXA7_9ACTN|nr:MULTISPECIES: hypothetical protein [unclassified Nocardioides]MBA2952555.1 hypothetical protein [Nocardioides sp. CGMCC 1.13656]MVQ51718.1 hypothetical protein [Nocardioides sp. MAH-18]
MLPREDVRGIFGEFGADGRARQTYLRRIATADEPVAPATRSGAGLTTSCFYTFGDSAGHTLDVEVSQYPSAGSLARRWKALRSSGPPVARTEGQVLSLPATRTFALRADAAILQLRYATFGDLQRQRPMSARERSWQQVRMRQVREVVAAHVADGSAVAGPATVTTGVVPQPGSPPYLAPCNLLTDAVLEAAGTPPPGPVDVDSSYVSRDPYTDVPVASCERRGTAGGVSTMAVLEVRVAGTPVQADEAQAKHLDNRYPPGTRIRNVTTDAGAAYVVDVGGTPTTRGGAGRSRWSSAPTSPT